MLLMAAARAPNARKWVDIRFCNWSVDKIGERYGDDTVTKTWDAVYAQALIRNKTLIGALPG